MAQFSVDSMAQSLQQPGAWEGASDPDTLEDRDDARAPQSATRPRPFLFLVIECTRPWAGGARYSLTGIDEVVIGRGERRTASQELVGGVRRLRITLPAGWLSRNHARILREGDDWIAEDLDSTNGSRLNGEQLRRSTLRDGDHLELGRTFFIMRTSLMVDEATDSDFDPFEIQRTTSHLETLQPWLQREFAHLERAARSKLPILLLGPSGCGKEIAARAIHTISGRRGRFVAVNCGALTEELAASQLFGHRRGAFSGAVRDELGFVRSADEGTLLLDEIADLPEGAQAVLLRVLQEGEVAPVGSARTVPIDVRILAATHRPIFELARSGAFRADLLARLDGFSQSLPPLRDRREDLGIIVSHILAKHAQGPGSSVAIAPEAVHAILTYDWPLNIRELEHHIARALLLDLHDGMMTLPYLMQQPGGTRARYGSETVRTAVAAHSRDSLLKGDDLRRELIQSLELHRGNISEVARQFGKARIQVHRWLKRFAIDPRSFRP